jgi:hypothetical protein
MHDMKDRCPYHGLGGSYIIDPKTGKRVPEKEKTVKSLNGDKAKQAVKLATTNGKKPEPGELR